MNDVLYLHFSLLSLLNVNVLYWNFAHSSLWLDDWMYVNYANYVYLYDIIKV